MAQLLAACDLKSLKVPPEVCKGYLESNAPTLLWVMAQSMDLDLDLTCAMFLGAPRCNNDEIPDSTWLVPLPEDKPPKKPINIPPNPVSVEMLHITDMHWDPEYVEGSEANCNSPVCCRGATNIGHIRQPAGRWGDYKCDTPMDAIIEMFAEIRTRHTRLELVIFTGDIAPHDIWAQTRRSNSELTQDATLKLLRGSFQDLPIFPVLGNHETFPSSLFSFRGLGIPLGLSTDYIYNLAWELWRDWLPPDQEDNVRRGSYYSVVAKPGLRVVAINTHYCFKMNWSLSFIWAGTPDPNGQLSWLVSELLKAEKANEAVYIIGHIPPGNHECTPVWSHNYARIPNPVSVEMLHITDMHWDPEYVEGSEANCNSPVCCRGATNIGHIRQPAGRWGDYKCDTPMDAIIEMFAEIRTRHTRLELVIFTGDIAPHDIWAQTRRSNSELTQDATLKLLRGSFQDLPIFPVLGNHETFPSSLFSFRGLGIPLGLSTDYIYNLAWELWRDWLPPDQEDNVRRGSYYSVVAKPGLRVVAINTHYCFKMNWSLFIWAGTPDPNGQLSWLVSELLKAEKANEAVYIIGHIPPGNHECTPVWSHNYARIVNRFESTIKAQFFGHTHHDEFSIYRDPKELRRATNIAYVSPSITAYRKLQPSYRIFHLDGRRWESSWAVLNHETWIYDLKEANMPGNTPKWVQLYTMKERFGMQNLHPQTFLNLTMGPIRSDPKVWETYHRIFWSNSAAVVPCDAHCKRKHLCMILNPDTSWALFCLT
ncbi:unnamed protein product [Notodromas monacha]|uniref:Sphingomyelin phosphodiesterase n=1 Tax=Notodromas monacha TaxID=399045 RepID=A0A7R9BVJ2_9CRUS|nr:unnamed protein product [Notodromas monacha]CAG0922168.1 unnamed protein product [Notodromas monacha]